MAYLIPGTNPPIYNVEQAVGQNSPNARGDVMLVQYLLHHLYGNAAPDLKVDGWIGPITLRWIKQFQIAGFQKLQSLSSHLSLARIFRWVSAPDLRVL